MGVARGASPFLTFRHVFQRRKQPFSGPFTLRTEKRRHPGPALLMTRWDKGLGKASDWE
jgi:hypothetical protein